MCFHHAKNHSTIIRPVSPYVLIPRLRWQHSSCNIKSSLVTFPPPYLQSLQKVVLPAATHGSPFKNNLYFVTYQRGCVIYAVNACSWEDTHSYLKFTQNIDKLPGILLIVSKIVQRKRSVATFWRCNDHRPLKRLRQKWCLRLHVKTKGLSLRKRQTYCQKRSSFITVDVVTATKLNHS